MKSIGNILSTNRQLKKMSIEDVQKFTKIHKKYLIALEADDYSIFDNKVHAKGFLKIYTDFLTLDTEEIIALWRREYEATFDKKAFVPLEKRTKLGFDSLNITPTNALLTLCIGFVILFFGYLFYQYKNYTGNPKLEVASPVNNLISQESLIDFTGSTDLDSEVFINTQQVVLQADGSFALSVKLKEGINTFSITSVNKLGKKTDVLRTVIHRPKALTPTTVPQASESSNTPTL